MENQQQIVLDDYRRDLQSYASVIGSHPEVLILTSVVRGDVWLDRADHMHHVRSTIRCRLELRVNFNLKTCLDYARQKQYSPGASP